jgi:hypothetical protein
VSAWQTTWRRESGPAGECPAAWGS